MIARIFAVLIIQLFLLTSSNVNYAFAEEKTEKKSMISLDAVKETLAQKDVWCNTFISTLAVISLTGFIFGILLKEFLLIVLGLICILLTIVFAYLFFYRFKPSI